MTGKRTPQVEKLLLEGCLPQDIDRVMEGYGMAMGPLATGDLAGLDIGAAVRKARGTVAPIADAVVAAGAGVLRVEMFGRLFVEVLAGGDGGLDHRRDVAELHVQLVIELHLLAVLVIAGVAGDALLPGGILLVIEGLSGKREGEQD
jgi:hypothetical protein